MIKKTIMCLLLFLTISISLCFISVSVFAEEIESKVTVRIMHDDTIEPEKPKENTNGSSKQKHKENNKDSNKESNKKNRLPQTNEVYNPSILITGLLILIVGVFGIYINNKRNGENKNEKN